VSKQLLDIIDFRSDRLFDGAVNLDWFFSDRERAKQVAESFVFHGPNYHGVRKEDIGSESDVHQLVDTATFTHQVVRHCSGSEDQPFTLAIAGYGTGKSHLATTLSLLLSDPSSEVAKKVLKNLQQADQTLAKETEAELRILGGKSLILAINGMGNFDLASEVTRQILLQLKEAKIDTGPLDQLRPRFSTAIKLINFLGDNDCERLVRLCGSQSKDNLIEELNLHNEALYEIVYDYFLNQKGLPIRSVGDETVKDVLDKVTQEYCGEGKPYQKIVLLFDEFGRFAEFATTKSQIAGSGVLQHLFEGIQANSSKVVFIGLIQFDLNTYVQRIAREYRNEILRVSTRFQSANKVYLSINLETIVANLIEKKDSENLDKHFELPVVVDRTQEIMTRFHSFLPHAKQKGLWGDAKLFHQVIRKGCWPLSPYALWFLFHLSSVGKHLQQRSAISLLGESVKKYINREIEDFFWELGTTDLWSTSLESELIDAERSSGTLGTITQSYATVMEKHGVKFSDAEVIILRAIVLLSKMAIKAHSKQHAIEALSELSLLDNLQVNRLINTLEDDWNAISWDPSFNQFDILGESVSKAKFLSYLKQRVEESYTEEVKADLFIRYADQLEDHLLVDIVCSFGEKNEIQTTEWRFEKNISNLNQIDQAVILSTSKQGLEYEVNEARGRVIYCYVEPEKDIEQVKARIRKKFVEALEQFGVSHFPIMVVFVQDAEGQLGQSIAELDAIGTKIPDRDKEGFGNLIGAHRQRCLDLISERTKLALKQRQFVTTYSEPFEVKRLRFIGDQIFSRMFPKILPFPFDGFSTSRGNAADSCMRFTKELMTGVLDYQTLISKPVKEKNRGLRVLSDSWEIFTKAGRVSRYPGNDVVKEIFSKWDEIADKGDGPLSLYEAVDLACSVPYGANLASAGLLFGVYFCARRQDLNIVIDEQPVNRVEDADTLLFKGKYLDIGKLKKAFIKKRDKKSESQWEALLDEWEQILEKSYVDQEQCLKKALELKKKVPIPQSQIYRYENYKEKAARATGKIVGLKQQYDKVLEQIFWGRENRKLHKEISGAAKLRRLQKEVESDPLWSEGSADFFNKEIEKVKERTSLQFDAFLKNRLPVGRTTVALIEFEKKMSIMANNLMILGLNKLSEKTQKHVARIKQHIDDSAEAHELISRIANWISENDDSQIIRIALLENLIKGAENYIKRIDEVKLHVDVPDLDKAKKSLLVFIEKLQKREKQIRKPAEDIWDIEFAPGVLEELLERIRSLKLVFEGCESDMEDFRNMEKALFFYRDAIKQLTDEDISYERFLHKANALINEASGLLEEEEIPWPPDEAMKKVITFSENLHKQKAKSWIEAIEKRSRNLDGLSISELSQLHGQLSMRQEFITKEDEKSIQSLKESVENRLNKKSVEWLYEKFLELSEKAKTEFKKKISG